MANDFEMDDLNDRKRLTQQWLSESLRAPTGRMVGNVYVRDVAGNIANGVQGIAGLMEGERVSADRKALDQQRQQQTRDWMGQQPATTGDLRADAAALQKWGGEGMNLRSPLAQAVAQQSIGRAIAMPEKQAELAERNAARQADAEIRAQQARELQAERLVAQSQRDADNRALRLTVAGMANSNRNANADLQREILQGRIDDAKVKREAGPKLSAAEAKSLGQADDLTTRIDAALAQMNENPDAMGLKTLIPDIILQRTGESGERQTRAAIGELSAEKAHSLYGAAFTAAEQKRANQFLPASGDSPEAVRDKLIQLRKMADVAKARLSGGGKAAPANEPAPTRRKFNPATGKVE